MRFALLACAFAFFPNDTAAADRPVCTGPACQFGAPLLSPASAPAPRAPAAAPAAPCSPAAPAVTRFVHRERVLLGHPGPVRRLLFGRCR